MSVRAAQVAVGKALGSAGIENAGRDARLLVAAALGITAADILREPGRLLTSEDAARVGAFAGRRAAHEPVSRILGTRGFYGRDFRVTPAVLDPRPCTETLVDAALEVAKAEGWTERPIRVLDIGTGSGALLVTLLAELATASGVGTDVSDAALAIAAENASRLGVAARATFLNRRNLEGIEGPFDLLVSNPPYIPRADIEDLAPDVRNYDPMGALDGGADGLDVYRALAGSVARVIPQGWALFEVGAGQAADVQDLLGAGVGSAFADIRVWHDLGQHARCVAVRTHSSSWH